MWYLSVISHCFYAETKVMIEVITFRGLLDKIILNCTHSGKKQV